MTNLKAVIPVAGLGMHMLPATKAIPKEMLPIVDKPMIQYIVDEIVAAGIKEILLVTHASKNAVENHFDTSYELESLLEQRVKRQLLAEVQSICPPGVTIMNVRQGEPLGLGHSILCARPAIGDNPFVVVLPDVVIDDASADPLRYNLAAMIARFNETGRSQVLAKRMPGDLSEYSVIQTKEPLDREGKVSRIVEFIEKPDQPQTLDSDIMAVGRYVLSADIWPELERTQPGAWGRIQLTDAIAESILRTVKDSVFEVLKEPKNYVHRAQIMWAGSLAHNDLTGCGTTGDWATHQLEHELSALFDVAHGAGLAALWGSWARYVYKENVTRFAQFAVNVMGVTNDFKSPEHTALAGIEAMEDFYRAIGMPVSICELIGRQATDEEIKLMADKCSSGGSATTGNLKVLHRDDMENIYRMANR
ncbi:MAG: UTP--glucose-1-phosphate uridylyltransferase GalF [Escherichia coli]|nr:UTP--glucose-1-phosphate uridylyltransferase GalF [Escherichia coli]MBL1021522.1 UTP--glucose-1-phosphate uridylyltransferase GalF [Escherichia coli]MBL1028847.1 UTP--glucose-1-phosphate uridylyltransferase GalF [Escherichia coli]MBL1033191.1 UTP--glucose-1-phosphate uridylyltransferase GalF [Escherichia coli]